MIAGHVAFLLLGAAAGWLFGAPVIGIALAAIAALARQLYFLARLGDSLALADYAEDEPPSRGIWPRVLWRVDRLTATASKGRKRNHKLKKQWRKITDALPVAALLLDESFNIVRLNETARHMLRIATDTGTGQSATTIIRNPAFVDAVEERIFDEPIQFSPNGEPERMLSGQMTPFGSGRYLLVIRDVTGEFRAEKVKTDFVANASHELRTPLTVLKGYLLGLVEDPELSPGWREPVAEMNLHVDRMQALVTDLLRLNQFEAEVDAPMAQVDIGGMLARECKAARRFAADTASIRLHCDSDSRLLGDESALRSVVTNLLTNAIRFTPSDGQIAVRWQADESGGRLSVADSGIGIDSIDIDRVTERFYRTDPGRARHQGGTGLGLAIVKHALAMHRARLDIQSDRGTGSTFTCYFPVDRIASVG